MSMLITCRRPALVFQGSERGQGVAHFAAFELDQVQQFFRGVRVSSLLFADGVSPVVEG